MINKEGHMTENEDKTMVETDMKIKQEVTETLHK